MHCLLTVALPGTTRSNAVSSALFKAVDYYSHLEQPDGPPGGGWWDGFVFGGRWHGSFTLTTDAAERKRTGALDLPLEGLCQEVLGCAGHPLNQTDCARLEDIDPDSLSAPAYRIGLDGRLREDFESGTEANIRFLEWIQTLSPDTWLINVDVHC